MSTKSKDACHLQKKPSKSEWTNDDIRIEKTLRLLKYHGLYSEFDSKLSMLKEGRNFV